VYYVRAGSNPALGTKEIRSVFNGLDFLVFNEVETKFQRRKKLKKTTARSDADFYAWAVHFSKDHICNPALGHKRNPIRFLRIGFFSFFTESKCSFSEGKKLKKTTARSDADFMLGLYIFPRITFVIPLWAQKEIRFVFYELDFFSFLRSRNAVSAQEKTKKDNSAQR
jgi:hypothetical protein